MAYQIEDQNGVQPKDAGLWAEVIAAHENNIESIEWDSDTITIMDNKVMDSYTLIEIHIEGL
ncbi:hypothetical protein PGH07_07725 [Sulfurovum sp. zt1-1]|uniref:Phage protein n=1 Tax=Sulfurovum zhangzhouensis TaxID=3019067 RepID=A0ABT7QZ13_9BACT|nr:hypothetical protein [Sulfurovum zhangzhouensis]MDM5272065.1 hypothetical protein [Sulfurovum zhangzhouensis]